MQQILLVVVSFLSLQATPSFEFNRVARLGSLDGPAALAGQPRAVARDSKGRFYVAESRGGTRVIVFHPDGTLAGEIGRKGQGPEEFGRISDLMIDDQDSLWVLDSGNGRITLFGPEWRYARSIPARGGITFARAGGGGLVLSGMFRSQGLTAKSVALLDAASGELTPIGDERQLDPRRPPSNQHSLVTRKAGGVWHAQEYSYAAKAWSASGMREGELLVRSDKYPTRDTPPELLPGQPRGFLIHAIQENPDGSLRFLFSFDTEAKPLEFEHRLEDVAQDGTVIRSGRLPSETYGFAGANMVYAYFEDDLGVPYVDIWTVSVVGK
jgi:hypothetical protein